MVVDPEAAIADGAPLLFQEHGSNVAFALDFGDDPTVLEGADVVVSVRVVNQRLAAGADGGATASSSSPATAGSPSRSRRRARTACATPIAPLLGLDPDQVRVIAPAVGGGFGAKSGVYPEYVVAGDRRADSSADR